MSIKQYANKETRERLSLKSKKIYGSKNRYRSVMQKNNLSIEQVEKVLDLMLERIGGNLEE